MTKKTFTYEGAPWEAFVIHEGGVSSDGDWLPEPPIRPLLIMHPAGVERPRFEVSLPDVHDANKLSDAQLCDYLREAKTLGEGDA